MSVLITNVSMHDDLTGPNDYVVRINHGPVLGEFVHVRSEGLAECLRRAADAVELRAPTLARSLSEDKADG